MQTTKVQSSLISTFVVRCLDSIIPLVFISEISSLYLAPEAKQAGLSIPWSQTPGQVFLWWGHLVLSNFWVNFISSIHNHCRFYRIDKTKQNKIPDTMSVYLTFHTVWQYFCLWSLQFLSDVWLGSESYPPLQPANKRYNFLYGGYRYIFVWKHWHLIILKLHV